MSERRTDRYVAWGVSWTAYAGYYLGRKGFSAAKKTIHDTLGVSTGALGAIDTAFLGAYSIGQFVSGFLGDRVGARRLVGYGMLASALVCALFGASSTALLFGVLFCLNGFAQSSGWPGTTRAMAEWTTFQNRGTVMAFWSTCYQVGGIVATAFAGYLIRAHGWRTAFWGPAAAMAAIGVGVLLLLKRGPSLDSTSLRPAADPPPDAESVLAESRAAQRAVLRNPLLWSYGASYFFIKYMRYALLFWLPYYLSTTLGYAADRAAYVSTSFEAGGIAGVIVLGTVSDRVPRLSRAGLSALCLLGLALVLGGRALYPTRDLWATAFSLALIGALLFAPDSLLSGAAAQDAGGPHAAATATGFVDGVGSVGSLVEGLTLPLLTGAFGWAVLYPTLGALAVCAALALVPSLGRARRVSPS